MDAWVIYNLETGEIRRLGVCAKLEAAKVRVEDALPDGEWRHGYRHIWDYVVERSQHRRAVAFRIQLQVVLNGVPSVDWNPRVLPWPPSRQRTAADEDSDPPEERLLRWSERVVAPGDRVAQRLLAYGHSGASPVRKCSLCFRVVAQRLPRGCSVEQEGVRPATDRATQALGAGGPQE